MNRQFPNIDFETLVEYIKQLSNSEKDFLKNVLNKHDLSTLNEPLSVYSKIIEEDIDFEKKWNESLSIEEFREGANQHIYSLPWKQA